jgi:hypothetical protein
MSDHSRAKERYKVHRRHTRELLEEELLHTLRFRVDISAVDDDILRRVEREWYPHRSRIVKWDWESEILSSLHSRGPRGLALAIIVRGQLCGLMAARVSPSKKWLSLTYLEGAPEQHELKGSILPIAVRALYIYRAAIAPEDDAESIGIRILRPLEKAILCYQRAGYTNLTLTKRLQAIVLEYPSGEKK